MWVKGQGRLIYNPKRPGLKRRDSEQWLVVETDNGISEYYRWWVFKRFGLRLQPPVWRTHVTVISDKIILPEGYKEFWNKYNGELIKFEYSVIVEQHWKFWTLPVRSERLDEIGKELGLHKRYPFHITIGRME